MEEKIKQRLKELENRSPEEELQSRLEYCKDAIKDKNFKLKKWVAPNKDWSHDHCEVCGVTISNKEGAENEAYANEDKKDWICKNCFNKYKDELNWIEIN